MSAQARVVLRGRSRRHRAKALLLTSFGWMAFAAPASLVAGGSWLGPVSVLVTGSLLLLVCSRAEGDLPFAAIGVGAMGTLAIALVTIGLAGGVPVALLGSLVVGAVLVATAMRAVTSASPAPGGLAYTSLACAVVAALAVGSFPGRDRIEIVVLELAPNVAPSGAPIAGEGAVPTALARAPAHDPPSRSPALEPRGPTLRAATRHLTPAQHGVAIWLVGLFLVVAGSLALLGALARLRSLRGARHARRTPHGYVLDDGERVELEPPSAAACVVVRARHEGGYRATASPRAELLGEGELSSLVGVLRERALTIALGTLVATAAAWLPLLVR